MTIQELAAELKNELLRKSRVHLESKEAIMAHQKENLDCMVQHMTDAEKEFWFTDQDRIFTSNDIRQTQIDNAPWGLFTNQQKAWVTKSSGTSGSQRLCLPYEWASLFRCSIGPSRPFDHLGITKDDALFSYDVGRMFSGNKHIMLGFTFVLDGHNVESQVSTVRDKVNVCLEHDVTFVSGVPRLIERLARYVIENKIKMPLRAVVSTGYAITKEQETLAEDAFECKVIDMYGTVETGNIFWSCSHGKKHINIDLVKVHHKEDKTLLTGLVVQPIFNYHTGDHLEFEWPDTPCECGSYLPVLIKLDSESLSDYKQKE